MLNYGIIYIRKVRGYKMQNKINDTKKKNRLRVGQPFGYAGIKYLKAAGLLGVLCLVLFCGYVLITRYSTYSTYKVVKEYNREYDQEGKFYRFKQGIIKCSTGRVEYLNNSSIEPIWSDSINLPNPIVEWRDDYAVIASRTNGEILLVDQSGRQGHINVGHPIEKVDVSKQGIVTVIARNKDVPQVMCFDKEGTLLVELGATLSENGYPINTSISTDGKMLVVSYLIINEIGMQSRVVYYDFNQKGKAVAEKVLPNDIVSEVGYMNNNYSYIIGMSGVSIYNYEETPKEVENYKFNNKVLGVVSNNEYLGILLDGQKQSGTEILIYNKTGREISRINSENIFDNALIANGEIALWKGGVCEIYTLGGQKRLEVKNKDEIRNIFPTKMLNQYIIVSDKKIRKVQLKR